MRAREPRRPAPGPEPADDDFTDDETADEAVSGWYDHEHQDERRGTPHRARHRADDAPTHTLARVEEDGAGTSAAEAPVGRQRRRATIRTEADRDADGFDGFEAAGAGADRAADDDRDFTDRDLISRDVIDGARDDEDRDGEDRDGEDRDGDEDLDDDEGPDDQERDEDTAPRRRLPHPSRAVLLTAVLTLTALIALAFPGVRKELEQSFTRAPDPRIAVFFTTNPTVDGAKLRVPITVRGVDTGVNTYGVHVWLVNGVGLAGPKTAAKVETHGGVTSTVVTMPIRPDSVVVWVSLDGTDQTLHYSIVPS